MNKTKDWGVYIEGRYQHVCPIDDLREHYLMNSCWCYPTPDEEELTVIVHHAMDNRESYEEGRKMS